MQNENLRNFLEKAEARRQRDLAELEKWSDRVVRELRRLLQSNRWRLGCWLSLKRTDDQSKEARRLAELMASRPRRKTGLPLAEAIPLPEEKTEPVAPEETQATVTPEAEAPVSASFPTPEKDLATTPDRAANVQLIPSRTTTGSGQFLSIIIPVYNAYDDLVCCLTSVQRNSRSDHPVVVIDDASTDQRVWPFLQRWQSRYRNFRAVRNSTNLGYTATINLGCELAGPGDLILLNSDTIVPPRWIEQMAACAHSRSDVATVTAISNAAGAFSVPERNAINSLPQGCSIEDMAAFVERTSQRIRPLVPTGNGFCMYLSAAARAAVGLFDAENFPRGYGEENDFCMRASAAGLVNLIDDATYVFHRRSASFGVTKPEILKASRTILDRLYPKYTQRIREWGQRDPLDPVRLKMKRQLEAALEDGVGSILPNEKRPCLLFVLHDGTGGTRFTSQDLSDAMAQSYRTIVLFAALDRWSLWEYFEARMIPVRRYAFSESWRVNQPLTSDRLATIREICTDYKVELAHVRHLLGSGPELLEVLHQLGIPIVFSFHDFYMICPTIQLLDETRTYCAGICTAGPGDCPLPANWFRPPLPWLKHRYVHEHQRRMRRVINLCDACVTTSQASRDLITAHFPALNDERFTVIEHGRDLPRLELAKTPAAGEPLRAIFFGDLTPAKGFELILALLEENRRIGSPIQLHVLGKKVQNFDPEQYGAIYHGPYDRRELPEQVGAIGAAVSLVPSPWPETYCHVLTESWAMGLPVLASDIGTLRERVLKHGGGWLLPVDDPERWLAKMGELLDDRQSYEAALAAIRKIQFPDVAWMARQYDAIYLRLLQRRADAPVAAQA